MRIHEWLQCPTKRGIEYGLGKIRDVIGDAFADKEGRKVVRKVIAVMPPDIIGLLSCQNEALENWFSKENTSAVYISFRDSRYSMITSMGNMVVPRSSVRIGGPRWVLPGWTVLMPPS